MYSESYTFVRYPPLRQRAYRKLAFLKHRIGLLVPVSTLCPVSKMRSLLMDVLGVLPRHRDKS